MLQNADLNSYVVDKRIDGSLLEQLRDLSAAEQSALALITNSLRPSANSLRELLRLAVESAKRDEVPLESIIANDQILALLEKPKISAKDRLRLVKEWLERRRYPAKARILDTLEHCRRELAKDTGLRVDYPRELEGDSISLQLIARDSSSLRELGQKLEQAAAHPAADKMFRVLKGEDLA